MTERTFSSSTDLEARQKSEETQVAATREEARYISPPVDIYESDDALMVVADLPGVKKEGLEIRVEDDILTIKGKVVYDQPSGLIRHEYQMADYYRQFKLSDEVNQNKISAELKHGVLAVKLPKAEKAKPREIPVTVG